MTKLEKAIMGLECHHITRRCETSSHVICPYWEDDNCSNSIMNDVLELLKEQEPVLVEHKKVNDEYQAIEDEFLCKYCGAWWMIPEQDLKYCPGCGRMVKWDG